MYFDYILESEDTVLTEKIIENAVYEACLSHGEEFMGHVEDYINLLEDNDHEPTAEFDEFMFETLSPYLENNSKYMLTFLEATPAENQAKMDAPDRAQLNREANDKKMANIERSDANKEKMAALNTRLKTGQTKKLQKTGFMQKVKNTVGKGTGRQKVVGGIGTAMKKGLLRATAKVGKAAATKFKGKEGFLGKVAAAGTALNRKANTAQANVIRKNAGFSSKKSVRV